MTASAAAAPPSSDDDLMLRPGADGSIGAWLLAGPLASEHGAPPALRFGDRVGKGPRATLAVAPTVIDVGRHITAPAGRRVVAAGTLVLASKLDGHLLLTHDDGVEVAVDGTVVASRPERRRLGDAPDPIPLSVAAGEHRLQLIFKPAGRHLRFRARVVDAASLLPPAGLRWRVPGARKRLRSTLRRLLEVDVRRRASPSHERWRLAVRAPAGLPEAPPISLRLRITSTGKDAPRHDFHLGAFDITEVGIQGRVALLRVADAAALETARRFKVRLTATPEGWKKGLDKRLTVTVPAEAGSTQRAARELAAKLSPDGAEGLMKHSLEAQADVQAEAEGGTRLVRATRRLERLVNLAREGSTPLTTPGVHDLAVQDPATGWRLPFALQVPRRAADPDIPDQPLVIVLHGLGGTARRVMGLFLDHPGDGPRVPGFVLAPEAFGDAFYRGAGARAVVALVHWATKTLPVDPSRVTITGVSMGGTGAADLALKHRDLFAAAAPLCGYQSYFVRRDTSHREIRDWERARMHHWSPASWAGNARQLPFYVAQGTRDLPLTNGRVLVDALRRRHLSVVDRWPDTGHAVWEEIYDDARLFGWLARHRRPETVSHLTIVTTDLTHGRSRWAAITGITNRRKRAVLDIRKTAADELAVRARNIDSFAIERPPAMTAAALALEINDTPTRVTGAGPFHFSVTSRGRYVASKAPPGDHKRAGLEGPIRAAFERPLLVVHGTGDPATARAERELALYLAQRRAAGAGAHIVLDDRDPRATAPGPRGRLLIGSPRSNRAIAAIAKDLPFQVDGAAIVSGSRRFEGRELGAVFAVPDPAFPDRLLVVALTPTAGAAFRARSLPMLLPDYMVYDEGLAAATAQQVLGEATVPAAGFFADDWTIAGPAAATAASGSAAPTPSAPRP